MRALTAPIYFGNRGATDALYGTSRVGLGAGKSASGSNALRPATTPALNAGIQLFLAKQSISSLPTELFWITNLTVLSLRE